MRALYASFLLFILLAAASAADLKVKVIDPQSAAVGGAQVSLSSKCALSPESAFSSAEGVATVPGLPIEDAQPNCSCPFHVRVLAAGFAPYSKDIAACGPDLITVQLQLANGRAREHLSRLLYRP